MTFFIRRTIHFLRTIMPPPDRWEVYSPMGSVIPGTKFVAFKVPLKEELLKQVEEKDRFSPTILMKLLGDKGMKLGGVIDLTFTFKYYDKEEFLKNSVEHKKIFTPGHDVPSDSVFQQFAHAVKKFDASDNDHIIGVHCTHGVNRTGYLICRYMIEEMSFEPDVAISLFGEARGHELERENYLKDLKTRKCGQSTYDPDFKVPEEEDARNRGYQGPRKDKTRWRHKREDHPYWRRKYHDSAEERGMRAVPGLCMSPLDEQRLSFPQNPGFLHRPNRGAYEVPFNNYYQDTGYSGSDGPIYPMPGQYFEEGRSSVGRPIPEDFNLGRGDNSFPIDSFIHNNSYSCGNYADVNSYTQGRAGHGHSRGHHSGQHRFNPIYSYRAAGANRNRRDEHRHDRSIKNNEHRHDRSVENNEHRHDRSVENNEHKHDRSVENNEDDKA